MKIDVSSESFPAKVNSIKVGVHWIYVTRKLIKKNKQISKFSKFSYADNKFIKSLNIVFYQHFEWN